MGDYADDAIDAGFAEWGRDDDDDDDSFYSGGGGFGGHVALHGRSHRDPSVCKFCGEAELRWKDYKSGRRQFNRRGELHTCLKSKPVQSSGSVATELMKARAACKAAHDACEAALALIEGREGVLSHED